jgi:hypothetical protein
MTTTLIKALIEIAVLITLWRISVHQDDRITVLEDKELKKQKVFKANMLDIPSRKVLFQTKEPTFASKKKAELKRISKVK